MLNKTKILITAISIIAISGCNKDGHVEVPNGTKMLAEVTGKSAPIKGYKTFNFGMSSEALLKVAGCQPTPQKSPEEQLVDQIRGQTPIKASITCIIDFMGSPTAMTPQFINNQLKAINIDVGEYDEDRFVHLSNELAAKYVVKQSISEDQRTAFNNGTIDKVAMVYSDGQIGLFIYNEKGTDFHDELGLSLDESTKYATPTLTQKMILQYVDVDQSKSMLNITTKGKTKSSDL